MATPEQLTVPAAETTEERPLLDAVLDRTVEYTPLGGIDSIRLSIRQVDDYLVVRTKSGATASLGEKIKFLQLCKARRLDPWVGDAYLVGYDSKDGPSFSLITSIQALLKRAESHDQYDGLKAGVVVKCKDGLLDRREGELVLTGEQLVGAWCEVHRKDRSIPTRRELNYASYAKTYGQWKTDPQGMIGKCAKAAAIREAFPGVTSGLYLSEEMQQISISTPQAETRDQSVPGGSRSHEVAQAIRGKQEQQTHQGESEASEEGKEAAKDGESAEVAVEADPGKDAPSAGEVSEREFELHSMFDQRTKITDCANLGNELLQEFPLEKDLIQRVCEARIEQLRAKRSGNK